MFPGTLLPVPILFTTSASRWVIVPNCAWPSGRGLAMAGTVMSWIIHPSYQPLSLLITNNGEISVKTSLKARGLLGSVGSPGLGSSTIRTAPTVDNPQLPPVTVNWTWSFTPRNVGFEARRIQQVILEQLACAISFGEHLQRQIGVADRPAGSAGPAGVRGD